MNAPKVGSCHNVYSFYLDRLTGPKAAQKLFLKELAASAPEIIEARFAEERIGGSASNVFAYC